MSAELYDLRCERIVRQVQRELADFASPPTLRKLALQEMSASERRHHELEAHGRDCDFGYATPALIGQGGECEWPPCDVERPA